MQFHETQTYQNLARAFAGECQAGMRYQMIAKLAMQEKHPDPCKRDLESLPL